MSDLLGKTIKQYRLDELLGDGGMGTVYKAYDTNLDRTVALKLMHAHYARQPEFRARLTQEAKTAARLEHPSIVRIYDFGESELGLYIAMEYVSGGSLRDHLRRLQRLNKYLPLEQTLQLGAQIADALGYAHQNGMIHRDVKPGNIILKPTTQAEQEAGQPFRAILTDFGLVKIREASPLTQTGLTMGTPNYMSPEQCQGDTLDGRSDLYSLGVVLYELTTNHAPFNFKSLSEALTTHLKAEMPTPASDLRPDIPPLLDVILNRLLAKDPDDRFATGEKTANILRSALVSLDNAPTRVLKQEAGQDVALAMAATKAPDGYHLLIQAEGQTPSYMPLTQPVITIGRGPDNDMVLPTDGVSRHHARLQATQTGWAVIDLGGINGTFVDGRRLRPNELTGMPLGSTLHVGPYALVLQHNAPSQIAATTAGASAVAMAAALLAVEQEEVVTPPPSRTQATAAGATGTSEPPTLLGGAPLAIFLARERIATEPGKITELEVEVVNRTAVADRVRVRVQGLETDWVNIAEGFTNVPANGSATFKIRITAPRRPDTPVGRQRFRIEVVSQQYPNLDVAAQASLLLAGYTAFAAEVSPRELELPATAVVTIQNQGNAPGQFTLTLEDDDGRVGFTAPPETLRIEPGQAVRTEVGLTPKRTQLFGTAYRHEVTLKVTAQNGQVRPFPLAAQVRPLLPLGIAYGFLAVMLFFCVVAGLVNLNRMTGGLGSLFDRPTPTVNPFITATPTGTATVNPSTATAVAVEATGTSVAATATAQFVSTLGDRDGDGLSDQQELVIGTNPDNPDTDGDGLLDGEEVLLFGTNPLVRDTDNDGLSDFEEVRNFRTDPRNPDTDGDTCPDGYEISIGRNPLVPDCSLTPTPPTPTWTPVVVTATPAPVTLTPSATWTPVVVTATWTPTPIPTNTPISTPTHTPTATTAAITPDFVMRCTSTSPTIDGVFNLAEWGSAPMGAFQSTQVPGRVVNIYVMRDQSNLYMAYIINNTGPSSSTDSLRVYIDTTQNGGDPDSSDRFFQVGKDGTREIRAGLGTNSDNAMWGEYASNNWVAAAGEINQNQWVVELQVSIPNELSSLANPYGLLTQVVYTDAPSEILSWPLGASATLANNWYKIGDPCR